MILSLTLPFSSKRSHEQVRHRTLSGICCVSTGAGDAAKARIKQHFLTFVLGFADETLTEDQSSTWCSYHLCSRFDRSVDLGQEHGNVVFDLTALQLIRSRFTSGFPGSEYRNASQRVSRRLPTEDRMIILDTNVVSELLRAAPTPSVETWLARKEGASVYLTTISEAELRYGVAVLPKGNRSSTLRGVSA